MMAMANCTPENTTPLNMIIIRAATHPMSPRINRCNPATSITTSATTKPTESAKPMATLWIYRRTSLGIKSDHFIMSDPQPSRIRATFQPYFAAPPAAWRALAHHSATSPASHAQTPQAKHPAYLLSHLLKYPRGEARLRAVGGRQPPATSAAERFRLGLARHMVQHGIDEFRLFPLGKERLGHIDEFGDRHLGRRIHRHKLRPRRTEQRAQNGVDPADRPFRHQRAISHLVDPRLIVHRTIHDRAEMFRIALVHFHIVEDFPETMRL